MFFVYGEEGGIFFEQIKKKYPKTLMIKNHFIECSVASDVLDRDYSLLITCCVGDATDGLL